MRLKSEDSVVVALVILGILGGLTAKHMNFEPILVAVLLGFGVAAAIYRFLGGVEGASIATGSLRLGGTAAVFLAIAWFVNDNLVVQMGIQPNPATWLALDHQKGIPVPVSVAGVERVAKPRSDLLDNHAWSAKLQPAGLRLSSQTAGTSGAVTADDPFSLGYVPSSTLQSLRLFNTVKTGIFRFTGPLAAGTLSVNLRPYPFVMNVGRFEDGLADYELVSGGASLGSGSLRNKAGEVFQIGRQHFLLMVTAADHAPQAKDDEEPAEPWVQFGIVELMPSLDTSESRDVSRTVAQ